MPTSQALIRLHKYIVANSGVVINEVTYQKASVTHPCEPRTAWKYSLVRLWRNPFLDENIVMRLHVIRKHHWHGFNMSGNSLASRNTSTLLFLHKRRRLQSIQGCQLCAVNRLTQPVGNDDRNLSLKARMVPFLQQSC